METASLVPSGAAVGNWSFEHSPQTLVTVPWAPASVSFAEEVKVKCEVCF